MWAHRALRTAQPCGCSLIVNLAATALCDLQAPEVFSSNYSYKADMWSVGITLYWCEGIGSVGRKFAVNGPGETQVRYRGQRRAGGFLLWG